VLATRHGGIPEAVEDGVNGILVAERDHARSGRR
jgi:glycosyltransferase involved in cell wall biosynthesis